jgi:methionyl aminopeptidase
MIDIKTDKEIKIMQKGGSILADVLFAVMKEVKPGKSELEIDALAEKLIREKGGEPGFKKVTGYQHTICACTNEVVVHGIPSKYTFKEGDLVCIDCGVYYQGFHTDMAETIIVQSSKFPLGSARGEKVQSSEDPKIRFLAIGKKALREGIKIAQVGNRIGHISKAIQDIVEKEGGYSIVRSLIGHGVGKQLHEDPEVPGFLDRKIEQTPKLTAGMTIAIEVIYNMGKPDVVYAGTDDWKIVTKDNSLSAVFERSVAITSSGPLVLTA